MRSIRRAIERGELAAVKRDSGYRIAVDDLLRYAARGEARAHSPPRGRVIALPAAPPTITAPSQPLSSFVGRVAEITSIVALLQDPTARLLTLTGPGGIGKTRLALAAAAAARSQFPDGVVFVALAAVSRPEQVIPAICQALGLRETARHDQMARLLSYLATKRMLLVIDNIEHLLDAAPELAQIPRHAPRVTLLATSRAPLRVDGEREYPVAPLSLPNATATPTAADLLASDAARLFIERANARDATFRVDPETAPLIANVCARLDGLPLAIELAAAQVKTLPPRQLFDRLERRLPLLTSGARDAPPRHRTMRDAIAWSYELLDPDEQRLFRQLAIFAGGFALEAAEYVGGGGGAGERSDSPSVLALIGSLIDQSLVVRERGPEGEPRFGMLETIREYGRDLLAAAGEDVLVRDRHLAWCLDLAERAEPELVHADQMRWFRRLDFDQGNMQAALGWAVGRQTGALAQRLGTALHLFWIVRGHGAEGRRWLEQALLLELGVTTTIRAKALLATARLAHAQADYEVTSILEEALALFRQAGDSAGEAYALAELGLMHAVLGDHVRASALEEEALATFRSRGDQAGVMRVLNPQGLAAYDRGDYDLAATLLEEALSLGRSLGAWNSVGKALNNLALVAQEHRDYDRAIALQTEALALWQGLGNIDGITHCLENIATYTAGQHHFGRAARLFAAAAVLRARTGVPGRPRDREQLDGFITDISAQLGPEAFASAWAEGGNLPLPEAIALAATASPLPGTLPAAPTQGAFTLTRRERDVLRLLTTGQTDRQIGEALFISPRTVSWHVGTILGKLEAATRNDAVTRARALGLL